VLPPKRIVCLSEEIVETLNLLGEEGWQCGISGYAARPRRISAYIGAKAIKILAFEPWPVLW
jgi:hypothetical protein